MCRKKKHLQWQRMTSRGLVDQSILNLLLSEYADHYNQLVRLMTKFGLLVHLQSTDGPFDGSTSTEVSEFLVPALLPSNIEASLTWSDRSYSTCYFVFSTNRELESSTTISEGDLHLYGFLPQGLFERLLGKAVTWVRNFYYFLFLFMQYLTF